MKYRTVYKSIYAGYVNKVGSVLPQPLRRPLRFIRRVTEKNGVIFRFAMPVVVVFCFATAGLIGVIQGGYVSVYANKVLIKLGFQLVNLKIDGSNQVSKLDILQQFEFDEDSSIFSLDLGLIRSRIMKLNWVQDASVQLIFPDTVKVRIKEYKPYAIWQKDKDLFLITEDGELINYYDAHFSHLPLVVGKGANKNIASFIKIIQDFSEVFYQVRSYIRIADRRWNIKLKNNMTILLPETSIKKSLTRLAQLENEKSILSLDLKIIDLRLPDRMVLRLSGKELAGRQSNIQKKIKFFTNKGAGI